MVLAMVCNTKVYILPVCSSVRFVSVLQQIIYHLDHNSVHRATLSCAPFSKSTQLLLTDVNIHLSFRWHILKKSATLFVRFERMRIFGMQLNMTDAMHQNHNFRVVRCVMTNRVFGCNRLFTVFTHHLDAFQTFFRHFQLHLFHCLYTDGKLYNLGFG